MQNDGIQEDTTPNEKLKDYLHNKLKDQSISDIEEQIAVVLSKLVGVSYKCKVEEIKYDDYRGKGAKLAIKLTESKGFSS